ncbi:MAG TPA: bifunctional phosphoglucose/phosphomannose isomerase [Acidimicrobiales bacterium]|nr:bifunctional phosphoglucose/phosphomannose isomerase [Acidimicrobiales bacterium]
MSTEAPSPLRVDSLDMWGATSGLPEQMARALDRALELDLASVEGRRPFDSIVVSGMGGSGIAGDVLAALAYPRAGIPVHVVKGYRLPAHVGESTLVIAVSCSGDTEETIAAARDARARRAAVVAVSGPGDLARLADEEGWPLVGVPEGIPQPRAAFGALSIPPVVVLERLGVLDGMEDLLREAVAVAAESRDALVKEGNTAQELARRIGRTTPLVHGSPGPTGVAAMRWKTQVNENAKSPAYFALQPELCHNEVAGWGQHGDVTRQTLSVLVLRYPGEHPRVARRIELVEQLMTEVVANVLDVKTDATNDVAALFDLVLLGDFVSLHLAAAEGVDPGPVPTLAELKDRLAAWHG